MNKKRLLKLADFLETVPRTAFDLESWVSRPASKPEGKRLGECGFAGCAVGWAAHAKLFRGFTLNQNHGNSYPVYKTASAFDAVCDVFDIRKKRTPSGSPWVDYLFLDVSYPNYRATPKQVAKRIRAFVASNGAIP